MRLIYGLVFMTLFIPFAEINAASSEIVTANFTSSSIIIHNNADNGNVVPLRMISGPSTLLTNCNDIFIDSNTFYVSSHIGNRVSTYNLSDSGDINPLSVLSGGSTGIAMPVRVFVYESEVFVTNYAGTLKVFNIGDSGNIAFKRSLDTINSPYAIFIHNDEIFLSRHPDTGDPNQIYVFDVNASGLAAPKRTIVGPLTNLAFAGGIAISNDEIFVGNDFGNSITVYDLNASGNVAPKRMISGAATLMNGPLSLAVCSGEIFVANRHSDRITVYNTTDSGNVAPKRVIEGGTTLLSGPMGIAVTCPAPPPPPPPVVGCFVNQVFGN